MFTREEHNKAFELYKRDFSEKFTKEEISFLTNYIKESGTYNGKYAIYKGKSTKGLQIEFIIDSMCNSIRRSAVENNYNVICTRSLCDLEFEELAQNYGTMRRRFKSYRYKDIETLIEEDLLYGIETPQVFIDHCRKLGYVRK